MSHRELPYNCLPRFFKPNPTRDCLLATFTHHSHITYNLPNQNIFCYVFAHLSYSYCDLILYLTFRKFKCELSYWHFQGLNQAASPFPILGFGALLSSTLSITRAIRPCFWMRLCQHQFPPGEPFGSLNFNVTKEALYHILKYPSRKWIPRSTLVGNHLSRLDGILSSPRCIISKI